MKKILLFLGSALLTMSLSAQVMTMKSNSWTTEDGVEHQNSQGMIAVTPSMDIQAGYKVVVEFQGTTTGEDVTFSSIVVDTAAGSWEVLSSWGSSSVTSGVIVGSVTFTATKAIAGPTFVLATTEGNSSYDDVDIEFSKLTCTVSDPNYKDPNVTTDESVLPISGISNMWGDCVVAAGLESTTITFPKAWECGAGWAWWSNYLNVTEYASVTVEFEPVPCQVQLVVQIDNGTEDGENNPVSIEAGATSVTINFDDCYVGDWTGVRAIFLQTADAADIVVTKAYMTYPKETAVAEVSKNVQIVNGMVYSAGKIVVYNVAGAAIAEANNEMNLSNLQSGVYFIKTAEGTAKYSK